MLYSTEQLIQIVLSVALVMFSALLHELAHGWVAYKLGDPTAKEAGRLTLDPRAHLDPFGSVVLPLIMGLMGGPVFAYAKPVPYNPRRLKNPRRDELLVALAGPACNLLQAVVGTALLAAAFSLAEGPLAGLVSLTVLRWVVTILSSYVYVNLVLCFFNLIPFPPLDGSKVVLYFLKGEARAKFYELSQYAMVILILVLYVLPTLIGVDPLSAYLEATAGRAYDLLMQTVV